MSDGHRTSRSTGRVSCKSTELKRCSMVQMFWNKYEVSVASPAWTQIRRPSSKIKFRVVIILKNLSPPAQSCSRKTSKTRLDIQNYGCNGNLLCCHGVVEKTAFPLCRATERRWKRNVVSLGARFTKYLTTILRLSYDNAKVTID